MAAREVLLRLLRSPRGILAVGLVLLALIALAITSGGGGSARLLPGGAGAGGTVDPLAWTAAHSAQFEAAAADGLSHVIYAKSPGGVLASARRTASLRPSIEAAASAGPVDADTLEGLVLLESAGRPDAIAGSDPSSAAGLTQILAQTATGLLGMRVDLAQSRRLTARIALTRGRAAAKLSARRAKLDQRFDPVAALRATERYLTTAKRAFGRDDLAVESYHMGIGNLETAVRRFTGGSAAADGGVARLVSDAGLSYAKLYFDSTPLKHAAAFSWISNLGDDSATYYWRVQAAKRIMRLYRTDPAALRSEASLQIGSGSAEHVLRPPGTPTFADPPALAAGRASGAVLPVPTGAGAAKLGLRSDAALHLRPGALAALLYTTLGVRAIAGGAPLLLTAATTDAADLKAAARAGRGLADADPLHATGYAFDIARRYASPSQAQAFQFMLNRLQALNLIAYQRSGAVIHAVAGPAADSLLRIVPLH